jgi:hypothetical protein
VHPTVPLVSNLRPCITANSSFGPLCLTSQRWILANQLTPVYLLLLPCVVPPASPPAAAAAPPDVLGASGFMCSLKISTPTGAPRQQYDTKTCLVDLCLCVYVCLLEGMMSSLSTFHPRHHRCSMASTTLCPGAFTDRKRDRKPHHSCQWINGPGITLTLWCSLLLTNPCTHLNHALLYTHCQGS